MKVAYIAGPFRAENAWEVEQNVRRAEEMALRVWRLGFAVICPHTNTRFFQGAAPDKIWLEGDLEILRRCDLVVMVPGWSLSEGARAERKLALQLEIPVYELEDDLLTPARTATSTTTGSTATTTTD